MAARAHAAAHLSTYRHVLSSLLIVHLFLRNTYAQVYIRYSRHKLLIISLTPGACTFNQEDPRHNIPSELVRPPGSPWITLPAAKRQRRRCERRQKRVCRAGIRARLGRDPHKPPLPSLFVTNARSLTNKIDELELITSTQKTIQDCCVMVITETWLKPAIPAEAIQLAGRVAHRADRTADSSKNRGGGLSPTTIGVQTL